MKHEQTLTTGESLRRSILDTLAPVCIVLAAVFSLPGCEAILDQSDKFSAFALPDLSIQPRQPEATISRPGMVAVDALE